MQNSLWNVHTYLYCRKVKCHWNLTDFFFCSFFFIIFSFFYFVWLIVHLCVSPSCWFVCFSFRSIYQHQLSCRNFKIIIHSCLEMLGMYGVTWFPLKSNIRTKSKWVKNKQKKNRYKSNQEDQIKEKCLCASWYWTGKNVSSSWIRL